MQIETNRLELKTLNVDLIEAAARQDAKAIEALGYKTKGEWPGPDFLEALPYFRDPLIKNQGTKGFDSWIMVERETREIVGGIGFLGGPDEDGMIELGFATNESHRRQGYCLEAATALIRWALRQPGVKGIAAQCEAGNIASQNALRKMGFQIKSRNSEMIHWKYR